MPATENVIEKNTSQNSFGSLGSGIYLRVSTVFRVFRGVIKATAEI